jgi:transposase
MPGPLSNDLRELVAMAVTEGRSRRTVTELFHVSASSVSRWSQRHRSTGSAAANRWAAAAAMCWPVSVTGCAGVSNRSRI